MADTTTLDAPALPRPRAAKTLMRPEAATAPTAGRLPRPRIHLGALLPGRRRPRHRA